MDYPKVSIIILNWNGVDDTLECIDSLRKITYRAYEIIIVDNGSSGNDVEILRNKCGDSIHVIANDYNCGFPEGCNIGMRYALSRGADYILLLNNDTVVAPDFLDGLVEVAESDSSTGILGSILYHYYHPDIIQHIGGKIWWWLGVIEAYGEEEDVGQYDEVIERDFIWANSCLIKKAVIDKISFMDPFFFFGPEEYDYCTRAKRAGFKIVCVPWSKVWHKRGASRARLPQFPETQNLIRTKRGKGDSRYYFRLFRTYGPPILFVIPFILQVSLIGDLLLLVWRGNWRKIKSGLGWRLKSLFRVTNKSRLLY